MKIPKFYDMRWEDQPALQTCRKDYEKSKEKLDYLRTEYELWALWIDKFYNGKYGIFKIKSKYYTQLLRKENLKEIYLKTVILKRI